MLGVDCFIIFLKLVFMVYFQLRKPSDTGYDQFWVDFNIGSQRMTLFCEQDSLLSQVTLEIKISAALKGLEKNMHVVIAA